MNQSRDAVGAKRVGGEESMGFFSIIGYMQEVREAKGQGQPV